MGLLVVGAGKWGRNHVRTLHEMGELAAVCDSDLTVAGRFDFDRDENFSIYKEYENALNHEGIEGVVIATPVDSHLPVARYALLKGLPVLIEKPVALSLEDFKTFLNMPRDIPGSIIYEKAQALLMSGHITIYSSVFQSLLAALNQDGSDIVGVHATRKKMGSYREEGALYSLGIHDLAMMEVIMGSDFKNIKWKSTSVQSPFSSDPCDCSFFVSGETAETVVSGEWSFLFPVDRRDFIVVTEKAVYHIDEKHPSSVSFYPYTGYPSDEFFHPAGVLVNMKRHSLSISEDGGNPLRNELEHFLTQIRNSGPFKTGMYHTLDVMKAVDQIEKGAKRERGYKDSDLPSRERVCGTLSG